MAALRGRAPGLPRWLATSTARVQPAARSPFAYGEPNFAAVRESGSFLMDSTRVLRTLQITGSRLVQRSEKPLGRKPRWTFTRRDLCTDLGAHSYSMSATRAGPEEAPARAAGSGSDSEQPRTEGKGRVDTAAAAAVQASHTEDPAVTAVSAGLGEIDLTARPSATDVEAQIKQTQADINEAEQDLEEAKKKKKKYAAVADDDNKSQDERERANKRLDATLDTIKSINSRLDTLEKNLRDARIASAPRAQLVADDGAGGKTRPQHGLNAPSSDPYNDAARHHHYSTIGLEGAGPNGYDDACIVAPEKLDQVSQLLDTKENFKMVYIRAPPGSGKTAFSVGLVKKLVAEGKIVYRYSLNGLLSAKDQNGYTTTTKQDGLDNFLQMKHPCHPGAKWSDALRRTETEHVYVILDEAQLLFGEVVDHPDHSPDQPTMPRKVANFSFFWGTFKDMRPRLHILFLASYGYPDEKTSQRAGSPAELRKAALLGFDFLRLSEEECRQVIARRAPRPPNNPKLIHAEAITAIHLGTSGHPRTLRQAQDAIHDNYGAQRLSEEVDQVKFISDKKGVFFNAMKDARPLQDFQVVFGDLTIADKVALLKFAASNDLEIIVSASLGQKLIAMGLFHTSTRDFTKLNILSPFAREALLQYCLAYQLTPEQLAEVVSQQHAFLRKPTNERESRSPFSWLFAEITIMGIARMSRVALQKTVSTVNRTKDPVEAIFQQNFAGASLLPLHSSMVKLWSAEAGREIGADVKVDFRLNGVFNFLWEFVRGNSTIDEHVSRFLPSGDAGRKGKGRAGEYRVFWSPDLPDPHWAVISFRSSAPREVKNNIWYFVYEPDFSAFTLKRSSEDDITLPFAP